MNNSDSFQTALYLEILFVFLFLLAAFLFYFSIRSLIRKMKISKENLASIFLPKLSFAASFLFVSLCAKLNIVRDGLFPSQKLRLYLDAALIFFFIFLLIKLVDAFILSRYSRKKISFPLPKVLHGLILAVLYVIVLFIILRDISGINITPFLATSAVLTMILGLAFQGVLSNILSGISLHFTKSFSKGDWVEIDSHEGVVLDTNWRETRVFDRFSNVIVFPNNMVASQKITNFSYPNKKTAISIPVKVGFVASPTLVFEALSKAAMDVPEVLAHPLPEIQLLSYDDLGMSYILKFWITDYARKYWIMAEVGRKIWYKFKRENIEIPVPLGDKVGEVLRSVKKEEEILKIKNEIEKTFHDLRNSSFLRYHEGKKEGELLLSDDEIRDLASSVDRQRFASGEVLFRQGESGETCYVVVHGKIRGEIHYEEKGEKFKSEFVVEPGGIFGEMSVFTGMPRTATGVSEGDSELLEIEAQDFARLLEQNPALAEEIAEIVSSRNKKNQEFFKKIKELSEHDIQNSISKRSIIVRLRNLIKRKTTQ